MEAQYKIKYKSGNINGSSTITVIMIFSIMILLILCSCKLSAQKTHDFIITHPSDTIVESAEWINIWENELKNEELPSFHGGEEGLAEFVLKNGIYPQNVNDTVKKRRVILKIIVEKDGSVNDVIIGKSCGLVDFDNAAIKTARLLKFESPGKKNGKPIRCYYMLPITYKK